jgi:hypothetical protein
MKSVKVLAATGMLGTGFSEESFEYALTLQPDVIGCDAGSSDPGPFYLAEGSAMVSRQATKRDLRLILKGALANNIPMLVGSCGTGGGNKQVNWTLDIIREIAAEEMLNFKLAYIYSEIHPEQLLEWYKQNKIIPLDDAPEINESIINNLKIVVGQMGSDPFIKALENGAQVVLAGRASDTSIFSAVPIMKGLNHGPTWHASKVLECGAGCVEQRMHPDCMFAWIDEDHFRVEPPNKKMRCTPVSVVSHSLYENADPYHLYEPSGMMDLSSSVYEQDGDRAVNVFGSQYVHADKHTIKLEGIEHCGFRRIAMGGIRDTIVLKQLDFFLQEASERVKKKAKESLGLIESDFKLLYKVYGQSGSMSDMEPLKENLGHEVGLLMEVIASTPESAQGVMSIAWHTLLHHPVKEWSGLISNLAFPFSPPDADMGPVYRFALNHVVEVEDPCQLFEINYLNI